MSELLDRKFNLLNDGFVRLVDYMGTDDSIVQAARVSYGKGTKTVSDDRGLIRYLMRNKHTTPFEMCELKLHIRVPMDCWRQWVRHRTASINEYSTRYSEAIDSCQATPIDAWRIQSNDNKQGSKGYADETTGCFLTAKEKNLHELSRSIYEERLSYGIAKEQARKDLPLSNYTEAYWKCDLHNLFHFLRLRMDSHAQEEIRVYAKLIGYEIVAKLWPLAWEAFLDYNFNSISLSSVEIQGIQLINTKQWENYHKFKNNLNKRELKEFKDKINLLGIIES